MIQRWKKTVFLLFVTLLLSGCGAPAENQGGANGAGQAAASESQLSPVQQAAGGSQTTPVQQAADESQMSPVQQAVEGSMVPITGASLNNGTYPVTVDSSSSMFRVTACELTVENGRMTAVLHMGGTGYKYVFLGTGEQAAAAAQYIPYAEQPDGTHTFTIPVEALDQEIACAAFSKKKELWYDRTLVFRADSLPAEAFAEGALVTAESLGLADGSYTVEVRLEGGSGRASVASPAALRVENGSASAVVVWGSSNYDWMRIGDTRFEPLPDYETSAFEIPVRAFDRALTVFANTTAMSTPHEIEYTLCFGSAGITPAA